MKMAADDLVPLDGVVTDISRDSFTVVTDATGDKVRATLSGKLRQNKIRIVLGDRVTVEVSPYDLSKGRIVTRR
jgi:translation initiation factor IF-1